MKLKETKLEKAIMTYKMYPYVIGNRTKCGRFCFQRLV